MFLIKIGDVVEYWSREALLTLFPEDCGTFWSDLHWLGAARVGCVLVLTNLSRELNI